MQKMQCSNAKPERTKYVPLMIVQKPPRRERSRPLVSLMGGFRLGMVLRVLRQS